MKLKDVCKYRKEKINISNIDTSKYISTDNMETNFGGFVQTKTFPKVGNVDRFYKGDILLSNIRPYFKKMIYSDFDNGCSSDVLVFNVDKDKVDSKYLYYRMMCNDFFDYVILTSKGTKMPRGDKNAIIEFEFDLPDMVKQRKIVNILNIINEKVRENAATNNNLYEILETLYKSELEEIKDDNFKTLDEFCNIFTGKKNANEFDENGENKFFTCGEKTLKINSYIYNGAAIIISGNGSYTGRTMFYDGKFDLYQRTYACTPKNMELSDYIYALYIIVKKELTDKIKGGTHGSAIPYIVMNDLAKFKIIYTDKSLKILSTQAKVILNKILHNEVENSNLEQLRDTLLPKLMNGEIDLENIEI